MLRVGAVLLGKIEEIFFSVGRGRANVINASP
jgi:hypothetical protein